MRRALPHFPTLLLPLLLGSLAMAGAAAEKSAPATGERLPALTLPRAGGGTWEWHPGKPAVLSFCAFWCDTWKEQSRRLAGARNALRGLPVEWATISVDGRWSELGRGKVAGPVALDPGASVSRAMGIRAVPYTVVVDASGRIAYATQGIVRTAELQDAVRRAVHGESPSVEGTVYLTFDDFPAPGDDALLDLLRAEDVAATFFCIGRNVSRHPELVRRAARESHSLQLHSWDHRAAAPQHDRSRRALEAAGAPSPSLYRAPGAAAIHRLTGEPVSTAAVNPYDFSRPGRPELVRRVLHAAKPGSVVLLHAGVAQTREALPEIIASLRKRGLRFGTLN